MNVARLCFGFLTLLTLGATSVSAEQNTVVNVTVESTGDDVVGSRLAFRLREKIRQSAGLSLMDSANSSSVSVSIVTLDPDRDDRDGGGRRTIYSMVISFKIKDGAKYFVDNFVGKCGSNVVDSCAEGFVADIDKVANQVRSIAAK